MLPALLSMSAEWSPVTSISTTAEGRFLCEPPRPTCVYHYAAFGGVLRSAIEFPELHAVAEVAVPDWTLLVADTPPVGEPIEFLGKRELHGEWYQLSRLENGLRLEYSHAGMFDVSTDGAVIVWYRIDTLLELVRSIVLGPAIALALELSGFFCLHGSAVVLDRGAVAFIGPKYFGKSTLAAALVATGARLVGDDLLAIRPGVPTAVRPAVPSVRLWPDMVAALPLDGLCDTLIEGVKTTRQFTDRAVAINESKLTAIYLLSPIARDAGSGRPVVCRTRLGPIDAAVALAHQTKLPSTLVGSLHAGSQLAKAAAVAGDVPVWKLSTVRDVARLGEVSQHIISWSSLE